MLHRRHDDQDLPRTFHYRDFTGIASRPRPGFVACHIPKLGRTIETRGDDLDVGLQLLRMTVDHDCLTADEVEARDRDL